MAITLKIRTLFEEVNGFPLYQAGELVQSGCLPLMRKADRQSETPERVEDMRAIDERNMELIAKLSRY
jgi:hypothetical protein